MKYANEISLKRINNLRIIDLFLIAELAVSYCSFLGDSCGRII